MLQSVITAFLDFSRCHVANLKPVQMVDLIDRALLSCREVELFRSIWESSERIKPLGLCPDTASIAAGSRGSRSYAILGDQIDHLPHCFVGEGVAPLPNAVAYKACRAVSYAPSHSQVAVGYLRRSYSFNLGQGLTKLLEGAQWRTIGMIGRFFARAPSRSNLAKHQAEQSRLRGGEIDVGVSHGR